MIVVGVACVGLGSMDEMLIDKRRCRAGWMWGNSLTDSITLRSIPYPFHLQEHYTVLKLNTAFTHDMTLYWQDGI